jgi:DNA repair protein RecO
MNQIVTTAIILRRTNYGEADRILTLLTPDHGKLRVMARGVRRIKSKIAGGIELFSVSNISYIKGRGEIGTLVSAQLAKHYGTIVKDITRTMLGYDLIKQLDRATEDETESDYFYLLEQVFIALDDVTIDVSVVRVWFSMQILRLDGHSPNLHTDTSGHKLELSEIYDFDHDAMTFYKKPDGIYNANHIKLLRLGFSGNPARLLAQVQGATEFLKPIIPLVQTIAQTYTRLYRDS